MITIKLADICKKTGAILSLFIMAAVSQSAVAERVLEEILVTAQKRTESLQDVPISIDAFTGDIARDAGVNNLTDLSVLSPSITMTQSGSGVTPFIRGMGATSGAGGNESPVAMYIDGVYFQNGYSFDVGFNNIERIEVLKGPQGTLFGRNVTGGLIHIITKDPSHDPSLDVRVAAGDYDTYESSIYGTTGITENLAADISFSFRDQGEGYGENQFTGKDGLLRNEQSFRTKWKYTGDKTDVTFSLSYADIENDKGTWRMLPDGSFGTGGYTRPPGLDYHDVSLDQDTPLTDIENRNVTLRVDHAFDPFDFVSISSYNKQIGNTPLFDNNYNPLPPALAQTFYFAEYVTQEFQFISNNETGNTWIAGLFYMDNRAGGELWVNAFLGCNPSPTNCNAPTSGNRFRKGVIFTESYAGFGEYTFELTDTTRFTAGIRYTIDEREVQGNQLGTLIKQDEDWEEFTYRAVLQQDLSDEVMLYASYNRGFKSGNFNSTSPFDPAINPEYVDAYEVGMKGNFFDNRLQVNAAAYYNEFEDLVATIFTGVLSQNINAPGGEIKGVEVNAVALINDYFTLDFGVNAMDTEYKDFEGYPAIPNTPLGNVGVVIVDLSGEQVQRTPELTANLGGTFTFPLASGEIKAVIRASYTDEFPWEPSGRLVQDSYTVVNASFGWRDDSDTWGFGVIGENVFDEEYANSGLTLSGGDFIGPSEPATYMFYVDYSF